MRRIVFWGTYDTGKPRVRLLLEGARHAGFEVLECGAQVWEGVEDKSRLRRRDLALRLIRALAAYPGLLWRYLRLPPHRVVIVPYPGHLDVFVLRPFAHLRGARVVWDAFLSAYDTVVDDRGLVGRHTPVAAAIGALEWLACRAADQLFLDTRAHAEYFERRYGLPRGSVGHVYVGAETAHFKPAPRIGPRERSDSPTVLFYGHFIPLHGLDTVIRAAQLLERSGVGARWVLVGSGQEAERIDGLIREAELTTVERHPWVPYPELASWIHRADVCLGIFGSSAKATRVIPNKVFQILAAGGTLVTADTPAIRELLAAGPRVHLVPPADPEALAAKIRALLTAPPSEERPSLPESPVVDAAVVGEQLAAYLAPLLRSRVRNR